MFSKHPPHIRKKIALGVTGAVGIVLLVLLVLVYRSKTEERDTAAASRLGDFYETISETTQSFFGGK